MPYSLPDSRELELQRFPIGKFTAPGVITETDLQEYMNAIASLPIELRQAVTGLTENQLNTPYRPGGWTLRQVVHHVADSHMNSYIRFKLALTEDSPTIKPYEEADWAELPDAKSESVEVSLKLLEALHHRWLVLLQSLNAAAWQKKFIHPALGTNTLAKAAGLYAWHGKHHLAHILSLRKINNW